MSLETDRIGPPRLEQAVAGRLRRSRELRQANWVIRRATARTVLVEAVEPIGGRLSVSLENVPIAIQGGRFGPGWHC